MRRGETQKGENPILIAVGILLVAVVIATVLIVFVMGPSGAPPTNPDATTDASQSPGEVRLTITDTGNVDSVYLVGPDGTRSAVLNSGIGNGTKINTRNNATVHSYLENNSVEVPAHGGGVMTVATPRDVTTTQLSLQETDLSGTDYTPRTAYLACLYEPQGGFKLDGEPAPDVSVPCHSPVLSQTDSVQNGTGTEHNGDTVTTPIILKEGMYNLVGSLDGREGVVGSVEVDEETVGR